MCVCGVYVSCSSSSWLLIKIHHNQPHTQLAVVTQDVCMSMWVCVRERGIHVYLSAFQLAPVSVSFLSAEERNES